MPVDVATLREHVGQGPSDDVLEALLTAALEAIDLRYGPASASQREHLRPFGQWVRLGRRAISVTSVVEDGETLDTDLYELWSGGRYLRRLDDDGDETAWTTYVDVTYVPLPEDAGRDRITVALVDLCLNRPAGLTGITVGPWSEQYSRSDDGFAKAWDSILGSLRPTMAGVW
jgi:hypothetical protein